MVDLISAFLPEILFVGWVIQAIVAGIVAAHRCGGSGAGFVLFGLLIGPFALILAHSAGGQICAQCQSSIHREATRCPRCQSDLPSRLSRWSAPWRN